jgi:hypothetical protein
MDKISFTLIKIFPCYKFNVLNYILYKKIQEFLMIPNFHSVDDSTNAVYTKIQTRWCMSDGLSQ